MTDRKRSPDDMGAAFTTQPFSHVSEGSVLDTNSKMFANALRSKRSKEYAEKSRAKEYTVKQVRYLSFLLGYEPSIAGLHAYVRFANGYYQGTLTRVHWLQAIALAKDGHNWFGNHASLIKLSYEDTID